MNSRILHLIWKPHQNKKNNAWLIGGKKSHLTAFSFPKHILIWHYTCIFPITELTGWFFFFCVPQILKSFFTASLYFCRLSSVSPSFFSLSIESLYSCTAGCPSSSSLVPSSTSSFAPSGRMRRRVSRTFFWDGLSSHSYSSISARVFSCSHASVFCKTVTWQKQF